MRSSLHIFSLITSLLFLADARAQSGWSVLNIPDAGRYDDISFINDSVGWAAGGASGWIRKTTDGGATWTLQFTSPYYSRSIEFVDANVGYCGSLSGQLYRTANGGQNWTDISATMTPTPQAFCGLSTPDASTVYGCGVWSQPAFIYKSINAGSTWNYIDMSMYATRLVDIHFLSADTGFATGAANPASNGCVILRTTDGGSTWTTVHTTN
ncbi:MAG TPA: YCF48-related protein, partial [Flavobacteriales bacterium]|nr:YCF48-related protein [Flavobacteriales bacterium]